MRPVADRGDGRAGGADQQPNLPVGDFRVVADDPGDAVGLVLPLRHGRVARPLGASNLLGTLDDLQLVLGVRLRAVDLVLRQFVRANGVTPGQLGRCGVIRDRLNLENVQPAELRDLVERERGVVDHPGGGRMRHERLGHGVNSIGYVKGRPFPERPSYTIT